MADKKKKKKKPKPAPPTAQRFFEELGKLNSRMHRLEKAVSRAVAHPKAGKRRGLFSEILGEEE